MTTCISGALFIIEGIPLCCEQQVFNNLTEESDNWTLRHINDKLCFIIETINVSNKVLLHYLNLNELKDYCDNIKYAIEYECAELNFYGISIESHIFVTASDDASLIDTMKIYAEVINDAVVNPSS